MEKNIEKALVNLRVDDLPLLHAVIKQLKIGETVDKYLSVHGNWLGALPGEVIELWLCYLLSTSDHKLSYVENWAENHLELLRVLSDLPDLQVQDFADDKLGLLLDYLSKTSVWDSIDRGLSRRLLGVYRLEPTADLPVVRLDAAPLQTYGTVQPEGLLQYGYCKHHANTGQFKVKFGVLDNALNNFSLPICHLTVSGNTSDDELYKPIIASSRAVFAGTADYEKGNLYVGDNKFGSIGNRPARSTSSPTISIKERICPLAFINATRAYGKSPDLRKLFCFITSSFFAEHYLHSSASNYATGKGLLDVIVIDPMSEIGYLHL